MTSSAIKFGGCLRRIFRLLRSYDPVRLPPIPPPEAILRSLPSHQTRLPRLPDPLACVLEGGEANSACVATQPDVILVHNGRRHQRPLNTISGGSISRSNALAVLRKPRVQSSVLNRSIATSSITASAAGTPPADQAFKSVRVAA